MDTRALIRLGLPEPSAAIVAGYLDELDRCLPAGRRARGEILDELADGLVCEVAARVQQGQAPEVAAQAAVAESGPPRVVAAAFADQLGMAAAHRTGTGLVVTGPLVGLAWIAAAAVGRDPATALAAMLSGHPLLPLVLVLTVPSAVVAAASGGRAARLIAVPPRLATAAAMVAIIGCAACDLSLMASVVGGFGGQRPGPLTVIAVVASLVRLSANAWAGRRVARLRAAGS